MAYARTAEWLPSGPASSCRPCAPQGNGPFLNKRTSCSGQKLQYCISGAMQLAVPHSNDKSAHRHTALCRNASMHVHASIRPVRQRRQLNCRARKACHKHPSQKQACCMHSSYRHMRTTHAPAPRAQAPTPPALPVQGCSPPRERGLPAALPRRAEPGLQGHPLRPAQGLPAQRVVRELQGSDPTARAPAAGAPAQPPQTVQGPKFIALGCIACGLHGMMCLCCKGVTAAWMPAPPNGAHRPNTASVRSCLMTHTCHASRTCSFQGTWLPTPAEASACTRGSSHTCATCKSILSTLPKDYKWGWEWDPPARSPAHPFYRPISLNQTQAPYRLQTKPHLQPLELLACQEAQQLYISRHIGLHHTPHRMQRGCAAGRRVARPATRGHSIHLFCEGG